MHLRFTLLSGLAALGIFSLTSTCTATPPALVAARCAASDEEEPKALMLSWQQDPTTTMTIDWHLNDGDEAHGAVCYKKAGAPAWKAEVTGTEDRFIGTDRPIFRAELVGLEPATEYVFQVGRYARPYSFRTMPTNADERPVIFASGGDMLGVPGLTERTSRVAMKHDLDFVVIGGDLAYANGGIDTVSRVRWEWWFTANFTSLISDEGRVVPMVVAIGNHEVRGGYYFDHADYESSDEFRAGIAPNFYRLFAFPGQPGYAALDFGDYLTLVLLDSDHANPIEGAQTDWLRGVLSERRKQGVPHVFPVYHVPAYPSHRSYQGASSARVREHWVPLFEANGVRIAFEHHDHTYKRTHPIRAGAVDPDGIVYFGDGAWGVPSRAGDSSDEWYIDQFASEQHAIIVTLHGKNRHLRAISADGVVLDEYGSLP